MKPIAPAQLRDVRSLNEKFEYGLASPSLASRIFNAYGGDFPYRHQRAVGPGDQFVALVKKEDGELAGYAWICPAATYGMATNLMYFDILPPFRRQGLATAWLPRLRADYAIEYVQTPTPQMQRILKKIGWTAPVLELLPAPFFGIKTMESVPLLIPLEDYPAFTQTFAGWNAQFGFINRLHGHLQNALKSDDGAMAVYRHALAVLEYVEANRYALDGRAVRTLRLRLTQAVGKLEERQAQRGVVWEIRPNLQNRAPGRPTSH